MSNIEEEILIFLKSTNKEFHTISSLKNRFALSEKEINSIITNLRKEGLVYLSVKGKVCYMPSNYLVGELQTTKKGIKYILTDNNERIYIKGDSLNTATAFDLVVIEKTNNDSKINNGVVKDIIERKNKQVVCEVKNKSGIKNLVCYSLPNNVSLKIDNNKMQHLVEGDRVLIKLPNKIINGCYEGEFVKQVCRKDDPDIEIKTVAANHDFNTEFSDEYMEELKNIPNNVSLTETKNRLDLRNAMIFTIDGSHTKDIDDAISLELLPNGNYKLGVHIANVSHYIKRNTEIFNEAYERGNSAYLLDYVIPMLHHILSNGICSLNEGEDRLTKSCIMEIDRNGNVVDYKICNSVINSKKKMTYEDVNNILEYNIIPYGYEEFAETLKLMNKLSKNLTEKRKGNGALEFASSDVSAQLDENGKATGFQIEQQRSGEKLIENFMVIANETVAQHIFWQDLPFIYRVHGCPSKKSMDAAAKFLVTVSPKFKSLGNMSDPRCIQKVLDQLKNDENFPIFSNLLLRFMSRAKYDPVNIGHFGLASGVYTHFTSPIRRISDLLVHMLLDEYDKIYDNLSPKEIENELLEIGKYLKEACAHASYKERQADLAEEETNQLKMLEYMEQYIGQYLEGVIINITKEGVYVRTDGNIVGLVKINDIYHDTFVIKPDAYKAIGKNTRQQYHIGNRVSIKVKRIDKAEKTIYFGLYENLSKQRSTQKVKTKKRC